MLLDVSRAVACHRVTKRSQFRKKNSEEDPARPQLHSCLLRFQEEGELRAAGAGDLLKGRLSKQKNAVSLKLAAVPDTRRALGSCLEASLTAQRATACGCCLG